MIDEKPQIFGKENKKTTDKNGKQKGDLKNPPGDIVDILFVVGGGGPPAGGPGRGYPLNTMYAGSGLPDTAVWMRLPCIKFFQF